MANNCRYSPILGWALNPGHGDVGAHGWRGPSIPRKKADGHFRIVCAGDSTTFGDGCSWQDAWPHQLETCLNQDADWTRTNGITEVLNLGVRRDLPARVRRRRENGGDTGSQLHTRVFAAEGNERFLRRQDPYHLNPEGNAFIAGATARWLKSECPAAKLRRVVPR